MQDAAFVDRIQGCLIDLDGTIYLIQPRQGRQVKARGRSVAETPGKRTQKSPEPRQRRQESQGRKPRGGLPGSHPGPPLSPLLSGLGSASHVLSRRCLLEGLQRWQLIHPAKRLDALLRACLSTASRRGR